MGRPPTREARVLCAVEPGGAARGLGVQWTGDAFCAKERRMAKSRHGAKDARFKHREPVVWVGVREATLRHVRDGDGFLRPDLCFWLDGPAVRISCVVAPDAPLSVMVEVLEDALKASPTRVPTTLQVSSPELAAALRERFGERFALQVKAQLLPLPVTLAIEARGTDQGDPPRSALDRATATAEQVSRVHAELVAILADPRLALSTPWARCFVLRVEALGWSEGILWLHGATQKLTLFKTRDDARRRPLWRAPRPRETRAMQVGFEPLAPESQGAIEADEQGWRDPRDPTRALTLRAQDVAYIPRPLSRDDVTLLAAAAASLRAWLRTHPDDFERITEGAAAAVTDDGVNAELRYEESVVDPDAPGDLARRAWRDSALPAVSADPPTPSEVEGLRARLREAPAIERAAVARALSAEGASKVTTLLALLDDDAFWVSEAGSPWLVPWALAALAWSGDPRVPVAMLRPLVLRDRALGEFVYDGLPVVLAAQGPAGVEALGVLLRGEPVERYLRIAAGDALYRIGVDHPGARPRVTEIFAELYRALRSGVDEDASIACLLAVEAARMQDPRVDAAVHAAREAGIWEPGFTNLEDYQIEQQHEPWSFGRSVIEPTLEGLLADPWWDA